MAPRSGKVVALDEAAVVKSSKVNSSPMSSTALSYFVKVVEIGSFTAAAQELRISQPSLSVAVRKLEQELGTQLLVRGSRGVRTTATGDALMKRARQVLRALEQAREEIDGLEADPRGSFVIGCHESLAAYLLPGFMSKFLQDYPDIQISLWNGRSMDVQREVVASRIDLGVVVNPEEHPDCVIQPLFYDEVGFHVSKSLLKRAGGSPAEILTRSPLVYVPQLRQVNYLLGALGAEGLEPRQHLRCSSLELVKSLVLDGVGVGILPHRVAGYGVPATRLTMLPLPRFRDTITTVRRYDAHMTQAGRLLLDTLSEHARRMPEL